MPRPGGKGSDPSSSPHFPPWSVDRQGDVALPPYYQPEEDDEMPFICSLSGDNGIMGCHEIPPLKERGRECCLSKDDVHDLGPGRQDLNASGLCVNWNRYYNVCRTGSANPHKGAINFDNIGYAWIVIFQVRPLGLAGRPQWGWSRQSRQTGVQGALGTGYFAAVGGKKGQEQRAVVRGPWGGGAGPHWGGCPAHSALGSGRFTGFRTSRRDVITAQQPRSGTCLQDRVGGLPGGSFFARSEQDSSIGEDPVSVLPKAAPPPSLGGRVWGQSPTSCIMATLPGEAELPPVLLGRLH